MPLALSESIKAMMFAHPVNFADHFTIKSGRVDLLQAVGITQSELEVAKQTSSEEIKQKLVSNTGGLVTTKERASVT